MKTVKLIVRGRVQGVFYRAFTKNNAKKLDLKGYVKNLPDGNVEVVIQGIGKDVDKLINRCNEGPPAARVDDIVLENISAEKYDDFSIKR